MMTAADKDKIIQSLSERRELRDAAKVLLSDKAFGHCWFLLRERWYGALMALPHDCPKQVEAAARLRAIEELLDELTKLMEEKRQGLRHA